MIAGLVEGCGHAEGLGVVVNERAGAWYVEGRLRAGYGDGTGEGKRRREEWGSCYFKSTDGHFVSGDIPCNAGMIWDSIFVSVTCYAVRREDTISS